MCIYVYREREMYVDTSICTYIYIYIHVYTHIHTYTHTYKYTQSRARQAAASVRPLVTDRHGSCLDVRPGLSCQNSTSDNREMEEIFISAIFLEPKSITTTYITPSSETCNIVFATKCNICLIVRFIENKWLPHSYRGRICYKIQYLSCSHICIIVSLLKTV